MHELPITKSLYNSVLRKARSVNAAHVNRVVIEMGILHEYIPEIIQKYWDYIAKGDIAEGAKIEIKLLDAAVICGNCGLEYTVSREQMQDVHCPECGFQYGSMIRGNELKILGIEIVKNK